MSGVVLRCPACGTTQNHAGECDACYDDQVRYYCENHGDGLWLGGPVCADCGARFGDVPKKTRVPPGRSRPISPPRESPRPESPRAESPRPESAGAASPRPPRARRTRAARADTESTHPTRESPADVSFPRRGRPIVRPPLRSLAEIIARMTADERKHPGYPVVDIIDRAVSAVRLPSLPVKGCIVRFALFVLLLIALAIGGLYLLVGGGIQTFAIDLAQSTGVMEGTPRQTVRGIEAFRRGDLETAGRELSQAAVTYPRSALALLYLARMRTDAGDLPGAGEYLEAAVLREPANAVANRDLGLNYLFKAHAPDQAAAGDVASRSNLIEADRYLAAAAILNPSDRASRGYRGCALAQLGAIDEAEQLLTFAGDGPWQQCALVGR